jgi:hypothetical protein
MRGDPYVVQKTLTRTNAKPAQKGPVRRVLYIGPATAKPWRTANFSDLIARQPQVAGPSPHRLNIRATFSIVRPPK